MSTEIYLRGPATTNYGLFAQTANSAIITNTTAESSLINGGVGTLTIPANGFKVGDAVSKSIYETGASMIYTSIVLFAGFIIFTASNFLGTVMLGLLTSTTLLMAMITNLIVLPSLLLTFQGSKKEIEEHPLIDTYNENQEDDGEYEDTTLDDEEK